MAGSEYDKFFEHEHDGIREYDNPLPAWWTWIFVASIFFSVCYYFYYHIGVGPSIHDRYDTEVVAQLERQLGSFGQLKPDDVTIMRLLAEKADMIDAVGGIFRGNCAQCHDTDGGGNIGPNLTDDHWKNVRRPADIFKVISEGLPGTAMPAWKQRFREPQLILLSAYVASLRGSTPTSPKAPEGSAIEPWPGLDDLAPGTSETGSSSAIDHDDHEHPT
jgi:cytochrome c oxidase cbb3-type subunit 3